MFKARLGSICIFSLIFLQLLTIYQLITDELNYRWGVIFFTQLPFITYFLLHQFFKFKETDIPYKLLLPVTLFGTFYSLLSFTQFFNIPNALTLLVSSSYSGFMATLIYYIPKLPIDRDNVSVRIGSNMPNVIVEDHNGNPLPISSLNNTPNLIIFYRGNWCVFCVTQLKKIADMYRQIENLGIRVVLVSPQNLDETQTLAKQLNVNFTFLVDREFKLADELGLRHENGRAKPSLDHENDTVFPAVIFSNERGKILYFEQTDNFRNRPDPHQYLEIINQLKLQDFLESKIKERTKQLNEEREKSQKLLLNILPDHIARELIETGKTTPAHYDKTSVLFTDFEGFTKIAEQLTPNVLLDELDFLFRIFDDIVNKHKMEKIKTIGDAYMAVGGIPNGNKTNPIDAVLTGIEMQSAIKKQNEIRKRENKIVFNIRIGIHTGPLVAGVVGNQKFCYDVWGDTVNLASRMESSGEVGKVNVSKLTFEEIKEFFKNEPRGKIHVKNKGEVDMYSVIGLKPEFITPGTDLKPNNLFNQRYEEIEN